MTRIQNRGLGDQIDLDENHIDMRNIERSHLNRIDCDDISVDIDIAEDVVYILTPPSHHILEDKASFQHPEEISQTVEHRCESADFQRVRDLPRTCIDKKDSEDWERPMRQMVEIVYEDQSYLDERTNSALHSNLEISRAGEYLKFPHHCSESAQAFSPLEKRE